MSFTKYFALLLMLFSFGCIRSMQTQTETKSKDDTQTASASKDFTLVRLDGYQFRRAYHEIDRREDESENDFMNQNPESSWDYEDSIHKPFYQALINDGIILDGNLNISALDTLPDNFDYQYSHDKKLQVTTEYTDDLNRVSQPSYITTFYDKEKSILADTFYYDMPADVTFFTKDLNQDGKEEIISIYRWYIVNGDNYELDIFELQSTAK
ncbi:MAG: hypothetical protein ACFHU9_15025 [Fluviicola sp.]